MASEATTTSHISWDGTRTPLKTTLFLVVCITWLLPGLVGHDPWKYDEAVVFGVVSDILRNGDWISFRIAARCKVRNSSENASAITRSGIKKARSSDGPPIRITDAG